MLLPAALPSRCCRRHYRAVADRGTTVAAEHTTSATALPCSLSSTLLTLSLSHPRARIPAALPSPTSPHLTRLPLPLASATALLPPARSFHARGTSHPPASSTLDASRPSSAAPARCTGRPSPPP